MEGRLLHTPEGVRDIYGREYQKKLQVQERIHRVFHRYGFCDIQTPTFEYFDMFSREVGTTPSRELYKFFDREGNTLVLRPDFTPSVVRSAVKYYSGATLPVRLCYAGSAFTNESAVYQGRLKETTQMGVELFGDDSVEADAEMIALAIDTLKAAGFTKFQVEIGNVEFFKGLLEDAGFDEEEGEKLRSLISQKSFFGIDEMLASKDISEEKKAVFRQLTDAFGPVEKVIEAGKWTANARALAAIDRLTKLYELLCVYGCAEYVSFDLGMLSKYKYYTGIIFRAYTYGLGEALATGGRYDKLMQYFGSESPSIGFMVVVDSMLLALERGKDAAKAENAIKAPHVLLVYEKDAYQKAVEEAAKLRADDIAVSMMQARSGKTQQEYEAEAAKRDITEVRFIDI